MAWYDEKKGRKNERLAERVVDSQCGRKNGAFATQYVAPTTNGTGNLLQQTGTRALCRGVRRGYKVVRPSCTHHCRLCGLLLALACIDTHWEVRERRP